MLTDKFELRNIIYTFATCPTSGEECYVAPCISLVSTCKQIYEYRPICLKAEITIRWRDVPRFFDKYFTDKDEALAHINLAPAHMTVITNACMLENEPVEIDLQPLMKLHLADNNFKCGFIRSGVEKSNECICAQGAAVVTQDDMNTLLAADITTSTKLFTHEDESWIKNNNKGRIQRLMVSHIGTNCYPVVTFYLGRGEERSFPPEFKDTAQDAEVVQFSSENGQRRGVYRFTRALSDYLERTKLQAIFTDNQYGFIPHFVWSTEEVFREERIQAIATVSDVGEDTDRWVSVE